MQVSYDHESIIKSSINSCVCVCLCVSVCMWERKWILYQIIKSYLMMCKYEVSLHSFVCVCLADRSMAAADAWGVRLKPFHSLLSFLRRQREKKPTTIDSCLRCVKRNETFFILSFSLHTRVQTWKWTIDNFWLSLQIRLQQHTNAQTDR